MIILLISCTGCHTLWAQIDGNKFNNLSNVAHKKDGHFLGRAGLNGNNQAYVFKDTRYINNFHIIFDFWGLLGEPCYDYRFLWNPAWYTLPVGTYQKNEGPLNSNSSNNNLRRYTMNDHPDLMTRVKRLRPIFTNGTLTVNLRIELYDALDRNPIGIFFNDAEIDLPTIAGKWNSFSMPGSKDWIDTFKPASNSSVKDDKTGKTYSFRSLFNARDKKGYAEAMLAIFRKAKYIKVQVIGIKNVNWDESEIRAIEKEFERRILAKEAEKKAIAEAAKNPGKQQQYLDELLGSSGSSGASGVSSSAGKNEALKKILSTDNVQEDRAARLIERADAIYDQIGNTNINANAREAPSPYHQALSASSNDKTRAREALNLYQQALSISPNSTYIRSQILAANKIIKWVMPVEKIIEEPAPVNLIVNNSIEGNWREAGEYTFNVQGNKAVMVKADKGYFADMIRDGYMEPNFTYWTDITKTGDITWSAVMHNGNKTYLRIEDGRKLCRFRTEHESKYGYCWPYYHRVE